MKRSGVVAVALLLAVAAGAGFSLWRRGGMPPAPAEKLTIAVSSSYIGSGLVFVAESKGYFAREGLEVTLQRHTSGKDALEAVLAGQADVGTVGDTPLMFAAMNGQPVSVIATIFTAGRAHGIVARADRGIASPADLAGKRLGMTAGTDGHFVADYLMIAQGQPLSTATAVAMKPEELAPALAAGAVDAVSTWEPWIGKARKSLGGNANVFMTEPGFRFGFSLATRKDWGERHQEALQRLMRALARADELAERHPAQVRALVIQAAGADPSIFDAGGASYRFLLGLDQSLLTMLDDQGRWAIRSGLVQARQMPNLLEFVDVRPLDAVRPGAVNIVR